jgi:hypothetical protein
MVNIEDKEAPRIVFKHLLKLILIPKKPGSPKGYNYRDNFMLKKDGMCFSLPEHITLSLDTDPTLPVQEYGSHVIHYFVDNYHRVANGKVKTNHNPIL